MASEKELIAEMQHILIQKLEKDYKKGNTKRDAHPKCLGLLKANFIVFENLPDELKIGVFKEAKTYKSLIRISNASGRVQSDKEKDFRGFALKLIGVSGERFSENEQHTQDFLLMTHPTMPLGTVQLFRDAVYYSIKWNPLILALKFVLSGNTSILKTLKNGRKNHTSPLDVNHWSTTPYQFGNRQVKYKIVPTSTTKSRLPNELTDDYLTQNMASHLTKDNASFDFYIQFFKDEKATSIEDASIEWKESDAPFIKVATIEIPKQKFTNEERFELAEQLSFSPANALAAHQPIGGINRARVTIYEAISKFRHKRNNKALIEPSLSKYNKH